MKKVGSVGFRLTPELEQRLAVISKKTDRTKSYYVRRAVTEFLNKNEQRLIDLYQQEKKMSRG